MQQKPINFTGYVLRLTLQVKSNAAFVGAPGVNYNKLLSPNSTVASSKISLKRMTNIPPSTNTKEVSIEITTTATGAKLSYIRYEYNLMFMMFCMGEHLCFQKALVTRISEALKHSSQVFFSAESTALIFVCLAFCY